MSEWGSYEIDDVFWDEPRVTDDHIVPDPEDERESAWTVKGERCEILNAVARSSEQKTLGSKNVLPGEKEAILSCPSTKEEPLPQILDMDMWCDPQYEDLATAYNSVHADAGMGIKAGKEGEIGDCYKDVKLGSADNDLIIGGCKEDPLLEDSNAALMNNSCHFSLTDICPLEGDLIFFGNEHQDKESCSLMDYGWANIGNFEDVDRLLSDDCSRNCESMFRHTMNSSADELRWPSSSSDCVRDFPSRIVQHGRATSSPEIRALKAKSQEYEVKIEFMPCNNSSPLVLLDRKGDSMANNCQQNDFISYSNKHGEQMFSEYMQKSQGHSVTQSKSSCEEKPLECSGRSERTTESEPGRVKEDIQVTSNCMDTVNSHRKQRGRNTQSEEEYKKQFCDKKVTQNFPPVIPYSIGCQVPQFKPAETQTSASSVPQIIPDLAHTSEKYLGGTGSLRQVYPQVSCMHAGYGYSLHQKPISPSLSNLRLQVERSQPVLVDYHLPEDASNQQQHVRRPFEIPVRLPIMTQKEKIEKLRWRQQMQARLAVEHQQQKFGAWNASMDYSLGNKQPQKIQCHHATVEPKEGDQKILQTKEELDSLTWQENSSIDSGQTYDDDDDGSVEATVLRQLLNMMTQLDIKTRLCIRDALYRLASNAMQRHCVGDTNSSSGNNSEQIGAGGTGTSISSKQAQSYRIL